jgi:Fe-S oxidoreductase
MSGRDQEPLLEVAEAIAEHGGGALLECLGCGTCTSSCPWGLVREHSVRRIIRQAALGLEGFEPASWLCLTCRVCVDRCPQRIDLTEVMQAMRAVAAEAGGLPAGLSAAVGSLSAAGNPWGGKPEDRGRWAEGLCDGQGTAPPNASSSPVHQVHLVHEVHPEQGLGQGHSLGRGQRLGAHLEGRRVIYFNCCISAYDVRSQRLARAAVTVLARAGYSVGLLGSDEVCCGDLALRAGRSDLAERLARQNLDAFEAAEAELVVTSSPHCRQAFSGWYAGVGRKAPESRHVSEVLADALGRGMLRPRHEVPIRAAFHDPCYLGRHAGIYEPPRELLRALPGLDLVELPRNREDALCCGGGGGGAFRETAAEERHSLLRVDEARAAGVDVLVTACPLCLLMLEDAVRVRDLEGELQVLDLCEVLVTATDEPEERS